MMRFAATAALAVSVAAGSLRAPSAVFPLGQYSFAPISYPQLGMRHCNYQLYASATEAGNDDFNFIAIAALNKQPGQVSFESVNYPNYFLSLGGFHDGAVETTRLGLISNPPDANNASFTPVPGLSDPTGWSFTSSSASPSINGLYVVLGNTLSGTCASSYQAPAGDVYLDTAAKVGNAAATWKGAFVPPPPPPSVVIDAFNVTHTINKRIMGCHSDPGYVNEPRGFYSQLIYGEVPGQGWNGARWNSVTSNGAQGGAASDNGNTFGANNLPTMKISATATGSAGAMVGLSNRGQGNEGLVFEAGKDYNGYAFVKAPAGSSNVPVVVALNDYVNNVLLASTTIVVNPASDGSWTTVNFTLTPSASTTCAGISSDPTVDCGGMGNQPGHICVKCGGEFVIGVSAATSTPSVNVAYTFLQPGSWGTFEGQPVLRSAIETLRTLGVTMIRQGGTVSQTFRWKDWRGAPWARPALGHVWGGSLVSGWGLFEFIAMCEAADIEPVVTLAYDLNTVADWADLVEYLYGDNTTTWGAQRIADGHPVPYEIRTFELGNEQYNPDFVDQVVAMEARRTAVGAPEMHYMFPTNQGISADDAAKLVALGVNPEKVMPDIHINGGGAIPVAMADFQALPTFDQMAINVETNAGTHDVSRAMSEAVDLSDWFNALPPLADRLYGRAASFCTERSGHFDGFDQGISFFLPNMTWLQPPGYVHAMITATWGELGLAVYDNSTGNVGQRSPYGLGSHSGRIIRSSADDAIAVTSQMSADGSTIYVRVTNNVPSPTPVTLNIVNAQVSSTVQQWQLTSNSDGDANTPSNPTFVSPTNGQVSVSLPATVTVPAYSFTIWAFTVSQ